MHCVNSTYTSNNQELNTTNYQGEKYALDLEMPWVGGTRLSPKNHQNTGGGGKNSWKHFHRTIINKENLWKMNNPLMIAIFGYKWWDSDIENKCFKYQKTLYIYISYTQWWLNDESWMAEGQNWPKHAKHKVRNHTKRPGLINIGQIKWNGQ